MNFSALHLRQLFWAFGFSKVRQRRRLLEFLAFHAEKLFRSSNKHDLNTEGLLVRRHYGGSSSFTTVFAEENESSMDYTLGHDAATCLESLLWNGGFTKELELRFLRIFP